MRTQRTSPAPSLSRRNCRKDRSWEPLKASLTLIPPPQSVKPGLRCGLKQDGWVPAAGAGDRPASRRRSGERPAAAGHFESHAAIWGHILHGAPGNGAGAGVTPGAELGCFAGLIPAQLEEPGGQRVLRGTGGRGATPTGCSVRRKVAGGGRTERPPRAGFWVSRLPLVGSVLGGWGPARRRTGGLAGSGPSRALHQARLARSGGSAAVVLAPALGARPPYRTGVAAARWVCGGGCGRGAGPLYSEPRP